MPKLQARRDPQYNSRYAKPYIFPKDQIQKLSSHGLIFSDRDQAKAFIRTCGYFRLSGYTFYFKRGKDFLPGTTFEQVQSLYQFDTEIGNKLVEALEKIELSLRFHVSNRLGFYHPFAHRINKFLRQSHTVWIASPECIKLPKHQEWLEDYTREEMRSQGDFVRHFTSNYGPHLPVWAATEVMTFGTLSRLFQQMPEEDCKLIAARMGIIDKTGGGDAKTFSNWINHFRYLRNCCAHHSRVWNRVFDQSLSTPQVAALPDLSEFSRLPHKLYKSIMAIRFILARIEPDSSWHIEILAQITAFTQASGIPLGDMGFPEDWKNQKIWQAPPAEKLRACRAADFVTELDIIHQAQLLQDFCKDRLPAERKNFLRYLCKKKAIFFHQIGDAKYYPLFQFSEEKTHIKPEVADVNEVLLDKYAYSRDRTPEQCAQDWWLAPDMANGFSTPPIAEIEQNPHDVLKAAHRLPSSCRIIARAYAAPGN
ncbi:Abi family protein [Corynebacterium vitaeruminis]|uniref:Abi family protein n=1 Tax=Corynebacterium vitaeruminis TaxID=38305 RepID=UPI000557BADF|nr:Abi family protein [Corynebacterium vitaeruminis]